MAGAIARSETDTGADAGTGAGGLIDYMFGGEEGDGVNLGPAMSVAGVDTAGVVLDAVPTADPAIDDDADAALLDDPAIDDKAALLSADAKEGGGGSDDDDDDADGSEAVPSTIDEMHAQWKLHTYDDGTKDEVHRLEGFRRELEEMGEAVEHMTALFERLLTGIQERLEVMHDAASVTVVYRNEPRSAGFNGSATAAAAATAAAPPSAAAAADELGDPEDGMATPHASDDDDGDDIDKTAIETDMLQSVVRAKPIVFDVGRGSSGDFADDCM